MKVGNAHPALLLADEYSAATPHALIVVACRHKLSRLFVRIVGNAFVSCLRLAVQVTAAQLQSHGDRR